VYALCDYLFKQDFNPRAANEVTVAVNDGPAVRVAFDGGLTRKVAVPPGQLRPGDNRLTFRGATPGMMYRAVCRYVQPGRDLPPADNGIQVVRRFYLLDGRGQRQRELKAGDAVPRGAYLESEVTATNHLHARQRYVLVENPKPACCEIQPA